jgi:hypothetical protein
MQRGHDTWLHEKPCISGALFHFGARMTFRYQRDIALRLRAYNNRKPIRPRIVKRLPIERSLPIDYQPLTPGLRTPRDQGECIGFPIFDNREHDDDGSEDDHRG